VRDVALRWDLRLSAPYEPGGSASWVAPARDGTGRDVVLKVAWDHDEARDEAEGLAAFGGAGAVEVHAFEHDGPATVLLLERCEPGTPLRDRPEPEQHAVVAELLSRLWRVPLPGGHRFRPLSAMADRWAADAAVRHAAHPGLLDPGLVRAGLALFRALPRDADRSALLCTDLHAGNVLAGTRRPWLLVDPKPYVGDPHYDVLQHLLNCPASLQRDPVGLLRHVADLTGLDAERVQRWLFARCVQESPQSPHLAAVARRTAP
jgi:streptomycin 6-kinase